MGSANTIKKADAELPSDQYDRYNKVAIAAATGAIAIAVLVLSGWCLNVPVFTSVGGHWVTMKFNTACSIFLSGVSMLAYLCHDGGKKSRLWLLRIVGLLIVVFVLAAFVQYCCQIDLQIDQMFMKQPMGLRDRIAPGRASPGTLIELFLIGLSLLILARHRVRSLIVQTLSLIAFFYGVLVVIGYTFNVESLYGGSNFSATSILTAFSAICLSVSIFLAEPRLGLAATFCSRTRSGSLLRRCSVASLVTPIIVGWLCMKAQFNGAFDRPMGIVIMVTSAMVLAQSAAFWITRKFQRIENDLKTSNEREKEQYAKGEEHLRLVIEASASGMIMIDEEGRIVLVNTQIEKLFGYKREELLGKPVELLVPEASGDDYAGYKTAFSEEPQFGLLNTGRDLYAIAKDGKPVPVEININPLSNDGAKFVLASVVDITERKRVERILVDAKADLEERVRERTRELAEARDQAQAASRMKSEFLANISHEIRTPMNAIIGMCNVLLKTNLEERQKNYATNIHEGANALLTLINDVLNFSKIEAGKLELEHVDFEPVQIVESTCELLAPSARTKQLSLMAHIDPTIPQVLCGDPGRLRQILINLTSNAIKFSDHGDITVHVRSQGIKDGMAKMYFSVTDEGIGITDEQKARLFQAFVQGDGSISRRFGGTGLGLSICKRLVELMEGEIGVESEPGTGSKFWFEIPLTVVNALPAARHHKELENDKILIVDDECQTCQILHKYVESWGMRNRIAESGQEALEVLKKAQADGDPYKVAIIDSTLPDIKGVELASRIIEDPAIANTRLILLTAFDSSELGNRAIESGFQSYLTKPVRLSQLFEQIMTASGRMQGRVQEKAGDNGKGEHAEKSTRRELILIVEDYPINQQVAQLYLDDFGFNSHIAYNGKEAVKAFAENKYALILMDCQMPEMDGFTATRKIRELEGTRNGHHIPIIAMTAHAMGGDRQRCLSAGMDDYVTKPVDPDHLKKIIDEWLPQEKIKSSQYRPAPRAVSDQPLDLAEIHSRYGKLGDKLLSQFMRDGAEDIIKLDMALGNDDRIAFMKTIHGLKGICGATFATRMRATCLDIEYLGKEGNWENIPELMEVLRKEMEEVQEFVACRTAKT